MTSQCGGCFVHSFCIGGTLSFVLCWILTGTHFGTGLVARFDNAVEFMIGQAESQTTE